jgi:hypothetical protein
MSTHLGKFTLVGSSVEHTDLYVFDDALVFVLPSRVAKAGLGFGVLGFLAGRSAGKRHKAKDDERIGALGGVASAAEVARAADRADLVAVSEIADVQVKKGLGLLRYLVISTDDGRTRKYRFSDSRRGNHFQPCEELTKLLEPLLGDRFKNALAR